MKRCTREGIGSFDKIKSTINCTLKEESYDQFTQYLVFVDLQNGRKQTSVAFMVYDLD